MRDYLDIGAISRAVSHALRHEPWLYELELDDEGWVPVGELLAALRAERPDEWQVLGESDLTEMISRSDKRRHELRDGKIRALYGHSVPGRLLKQPAEPPAVLYHGTSPEAVALIRSDGLRPMGRQYVHLSIDQDTAKQVGSRKSRTPILLLVNAGEAHASGVMFYRGNDLVWLADFVPSAFVE
ncbi:RNA 2'-phosphotransferase [Dyella sp. AD56]|uniref:RNA 2'-phosphotransferase n=1 Tax=Dyella sp. AD56 TaxID=1528744 RepID=UPI0018ECF9A5|nr:RNA 2'-phosphotransferase [Dyella sp. AD56]